MNRGKPYVYSIGGVVNDAEKGFFWTLLTGLAGGSARSLVPFEDGKMFHFISLPLFLLKYIPSL